MVSRQLAVWHRGRCPRTEDITRSVQYRLVRNVFGQTHTTSPRFKKNRVTHDVHSRCVCHPRRRSGHEYIGNACAGHPAVFVPSYSQIPVSMRGSLTTPSPRATTDGQFLIRNNVVANDRDTMRHWYAVHSPTAGALPGVVIASIWEVLSKGRVCKYIVPMAMCSRTSMGSEERNITGF